MDLKVGGFVYDRRLNAHEIVGETSRSWLVNGQYSWQEKTKIPKSAMRTKGNDGDYWPTFFATEELARDEVFVLEHARKIARQIEGVRDAAVLRKIAALIGYEE